MIFFVALNVIPNLANGAEGLPNGLLFLLI